MCVQINLQPFIDMDASQVLNSDPSTNLRSILGVSPGILRSDVTIDPELILVVHFRESVKLRGIKLTASEAKFDGDDECSGPSVLKLFLHRPHYSFNECASETPTEAITLTKQQIEKGEEIRLKFVKWQNVTSLTIFIEKNQEEAGQDRHFIHSCVCV